MYAIVEETYSQLGKRRELRTPFQSHSHSQNFLQTPSKAQHFPFLSFLIRFPDTISYMLTCRFSAVEMILLQAMVGFIIWKGRSQCASDLEIWLYFPSPSSHAPRNHSLLPYNLTNLWRVCSVLGQEPNSPHKSRKTLGPYEGHGLKWGGGGAMKIFKDLFEGERAGTWMLLEKKAGTPEFPWQVMSKQPAWRWTRRQAWKVPGLPLRCSRASGDNRTNCT